MFSIPRVPVCFYAYAAKPREVAEIIEDTIVRINKIGKCRIQGWKEFTGAVGQPVMAPICAAIDKCDLFLCDLTNLNPNVLFELGYAIAKNKHIWVSLDKTYEQSIKEWNDFAPLANMIYAPYRNTDELVSRFLSDRPFETQIPTLYESMFQSIPAISEKPYFLYLKCITPTEASVRLTRRLNDTRAAIPLKTDDPDEVISQPLTWYMQNLRNSFGVVAHLLDDI